MCHDSQKLSMKNRRGVSNIIGSLIVLALVASVGSVILFQGLGQINSFNYDLTFYDNTRNSELREDVIFQHVRFDNSTGNKSNVEIYLANIGTVEPTITTVTMVHNISQEIVLAWNVVDSSETDDNSRTILLDGDKIITLTAVLECPVISPVPSLDDCLAPEWDDPYYEKSEYKISITTSRGNFFSTVATPWNT